MLEIYIKLIPVFTYFLLGIALKATKFADYKHGEFMLKFMFYITLPALIILRLSRIPIGLEKLVLPFLNMGINIACMLVTLSVLQLVKPEKESQGVIIISTMIINNVFMFPFILTGMGDRAFTDAVILDIGNAVTTVTLAYAIAFRYGPGNVTYRIMLEKIFKLPMFWAIGLAVWLSAHSMQLPSVVSNILDPLGQMTGPLILISLGIFFSPQINKLKFVSLTLVIRMIIGPIIGALVAGLAGLQGTTFVVVVLCAAAPVGFNALTFSSLAKLDTQFASSVVSFSILAGMVCVPLLMYLLNA